MFGLWIEIFFCQAFRKDFFWYSPRVRKNPVPESEIEVARRLREIRSAMKLSRVAFAEEIGINVLRLASYDQGRVPLPYAVGRMVCRKFSISPAWLALGEGPMRQLFEIAPLIVRDNERRSFLEVFTKDLAPQFTHRMSYLKIGFDQGTLEHLLARMPPVGSGYSELHLSALRNMIEGAIAQIPDASAYALHMIRASQSFLKNLNQPTVDNDGSIGSVRDVSKLDRPLQNLISRLKRLTKTRGAKAELAREFGVSNQAVDRWLSGKSAPSARLALALNEWAGPKQVIEKKSSDAASTASEPEAQNLRKYEKSKSPKPE